MRNLKLSIVAGLMVVAAGVLPATPVLAAQDLFTEACTAASSSAVCKSKAEGASRDEAATQVRDVINLILYILGILAIIMIVLGGFRYVFSNGEAGAAKQGRDTIIYAAAGLIIAMLAFAIVNFFIFNLQAPAATTTDPNKNSGTNNTSTK